MNTERESLQSQQAKEVPDPVLSVSYLLGEVKELRRLIVETRQIELGSAAHIEELEKRIAKLESGGY